MTPCKHVHWWCPRCSVPARALMRERSKRRAELFSLSQSVSAARSQRLLMSLYCCWISKLSKSVGEMVLMVSRLEENTFNLQFRHKDTKASKVSAYRERRRHDNRSFTRLANTCFGRFSVGTISISSAARWCTVTYITHHTLLIAALSFNVHNVICK